MRKENRTKTGNKGRVSFFRSSVIISGMKEVTEQTFWTNTLYTCCKQQHTVYAFIRSLDSVNSYLGEVLITCEERCVFLNGMNPFLHLWMVFNDLKGRNWNGIALFDTLEKMGVISVIIPFQSALRSQVTTQHNHPIVTKAMAKMTAHFLKN